MDLLAGIDAYLWISMVLSVKTRAKSKNRSYQTELTHRKSYIYLK